MSDTAESFLEGFWKRFGALPAIALHKLVVGDPAWKKAQENGPGSEIHVEPHRGGKPVVRASAPALPARQQAKTDLPPFEGAVRDKIAAHAGRSEARRVGQECVRTCRDGCCAYS